MKSLYYELSSESAIVLTLLIGVVAWCLQSIGMITTVVALLLSCPIVLCITLALIRMNTWIDPDVYFAGREYQLRCDDNGK